MLRHVHVHRSLLGWRCVNGATAADALGDTARGCCAETGNPYPLKEGKYQNQTVGVGPSSTPEPAVSGKPQTAYA